MKTNRFIYVASALLLAGSLAFTSCKKRQAAKDEDGQSSADSRNVQSENDAAINDVNAEIGALTSLRGKSANSNAVEEYYRAFGITATYYTVDTTNIQNGSIVINYNGTVVSNRKREGSIKLTILDYVNGKRWKQQGCIIQVDFMDYKVTRASDGKFVKLNGTQYYKNETGGSWWEFLFIKTQSSLGTSVTGSNLNVTFDDGKTAVYNINRKFTFTLPNNILTCTGEGIGTSESLSSLENYGTTRDGDAFTSQVKTPIVWNVTCGAWAPIQGNVEIKVEDKDFTLNCTFGVDKDGNVVTVGSNACPYGWKVDWKYKNKARKKIFGYL